ncbi:MAG TPA: YitT family protein [Bacillota bacterium]|nr:YitT family protein [Bacillota bacterium]
MFQWLFILMGSIIMAFSFNQFLIPHHVLSGGISGISMILSNFLPINAGVLMWVLNLPLLIIGWKFLGRSFIGKSLVSITIITIAMLYIPVTPIADDPILCSVFGGVLLGIAGGLVFRAAGSTGGFDIVGLLLTKKRDLPLGELLFGLNAVVVFIGGYLFGWNLAMYTLLSMYVSSRITNMIHPQHLKLTLMIMTNKGDELQEALLSHFQRGVTVLEGKGAYTKQSRSVLIMVISRFELPSVQKVIKETDSQAFVDILSTVSVMGKFAKIDPSASM